MNFIMSLELLNKIDEPTEKFMLENEIKNDISLSIYDFDNALKFYEKIKVKPSGSYIFFCYNQDKYTSYAFYKATNKKIYIIEAFRNNIIAYHDASMFEISNN